jgi:hypothetical protein
MSNSKPLMACAALGILAVAATPLFAQTKVYATGLLNRQERCWSRNSGLNRIVGGSRSLVQAESGER